MNKQTLSIIIITMMLLVPVASASPIDDANIWIQNIKQSIQTASIPVIGTTIIKCNDGASCLQSGENWVMQMNSASNDLKFGLQLPAGTSQIVGSATVKTQGTVTVVIEEKIATREVPIMSASYNYLVPSTLSYKSYPVQAYQRSGAVTNIFTHYSIQLLAPLGDSAVIAKRFNWQDRSTFTMVDGAGNVATITPQYQTSGGLQVDIGDVVFVNDGITSNYKMYSKVSFQTKLEKINNIIQTQSTIFFNPYPNIVDWKTYLQEMESDGLIPYTDIPFAALPGDNLVIMQYPARSVTTQLEAVIPKAMAQTIWVYQNDGKPRIDTLTITPNPVYVGSLATVDLWVTNIGTSSDTFTASIPSVNGGTITYITNSLTIGVNQQGHFIFKYAPTVSVKTQVSLNAIVTAGSTGYRDEKTIIADSRPTTSDTKTGKLTVILYNDKKQVVSTAPIYVDGVAKGNGRIDMDFPIGEHYIETNNVTNPTLFAPIPAKITLTSSGYTLEMYFSTTPPGIDYTWIFWLVLLIIIGIIGYVTGWYRLPMFWYGLVALFIIYELYLVVTGVVTDIENLIPW